MQRHLLEQYCVTTLRDTWHCQSKDAVVVLGAALQNLPRDVFLQIDCDIASVPLLAGMCTPGVPAQRDAARLSMHA